MHAHKKREWTDWCYTSYDLEFVPNHSDIKYIIYQKEECPDTKRIHLQGYLELKKPYTFTEIRKEITFQHHVDHRKGSKKQAIDYCRKTDSRIDGPWEPLGPHKGQGERNDLNSVRERIEAGEDFGSIAQDHFKTFLRYHKGFNEYRKLLMTTRREAPKVYLYWGNAGTGKTKRAYESHNPEDIYFKDNTKWWDGYTQQKCVIIDEFDWHWDRSYLLRLLDRYPMSVEVKGGVVPFNSPTIYITCNDNPEDHWMLFDEALKRRITEIIHFV